MSINDWLNKFVTAWQQHDIDAVMGLFTDDVEYWETPFIKLRDKAHLREEWQCVLLQENIKVEAVVFSSENSNYAIREHTSYDSGHENHESSGTYLMHLNSDGLCDYFHYTSVSSR